MTIFYNRSFSNRNTFTSNLRERVSPLFCPLPQKDTVLVSWATWRISFTIITGTHYRFLKSFLQLCVCGKTFISYQRDARKLCMLQSRTTFPFMKKYHFALSFKKLAFSSWDAQEKWYSLIRKCRFALWTRQKHNLSQSQEINHYCNRIYILNTF